MSERSSDVEDPRQDALREESDPENPPRPSTTTTISNAEDPRQDASPSRRSTTTSATAMKEARDLARLWDQWDLEDKKAKAEARAAARSANKTKNDQHQPQKGNEGHVGASCQDGGKSNSKQDKYGLHNRTSTSQDESIQNIPKAKYGLHRPNPTTSDRTALSAERATTTPMRPSWGPKQLRGLRRKSRPVPQNAAGPVDEPEICIGSGLAVTSENIQTITMPNMPTQRASLMEAMPINTISTLNLAQAVEVDPGELERIREQKKKKEQQYRRIGYLVVSMAVLAIIIFIAVILKREKPQPPTISPTTVPSMSPSTVPSSAPTSLLEEFEKSLPSYTQKSLLNPWSAQTRALAWLEDHPEFPTMPNWRKKQLFALATFHYSFEGDKWKQQIRDDWMQYDKDECQWFTSKYGGFAPDGSFAVFTVGEDSSTRDSSPCNNNEKYQTLWLEQLELNSTQPTIPPEIAMLTGLEAISLRENQIAATIHGFLPSEIALLSSLRRLDLSQNSFSSRLPSFLGLMTPLSYLNLSHNSFLGQLTLPSELGSATALKTLDLSDNLLSGTIPTELGLMTSMLSLNLNENGLTGGIPTEVGLLTRLGYLYLSRNALNRVPTELGLITSLWVLDLHQNALSGIPIQLGQMPSLWSLDLSENSFGDSLVVLPSELGLLTSLVKFNISNTDVKGMIPVELCFLESDDCFDRWNNNTCVLAFDCSVEGLCGCDCPCSSATVDADI